jgi:transposase
LISKVSGVDSSYCIPDVVWDRIIAVLLSPSIRRKKKKKAGRPRMDDRKAMSAIFFVLRTGCQWNALPRSLGASSTVHDRFQEWRKAGVFKRMWIDGLAMYDKKNWDRLEMAGYGWRDYKSTSWGKKAQDQILQTELNQVQNAVF